LKNKVPRKKFGVKREEVTEEWRRLHNKELYVLYPSPDICVIDSKVITLAEHVALMRERRGACRILFGKPEERRKFGRA
jgi:hypothetical protein